MRGVSDARGCQQHPHVHMRVPCVPSARLPCVPSARSPVSPRPGPLCPLGQVRLVETRMRPPALGLTSARGQLGLAMDGEDSDGPVKERLLTTLLDMGFPAARAKVRPRRSACPAARRRYAHLARYGH